MNRELTMSHEQEHERLSTLRRFKSRVPHAAKHQTQILIVDDDAEVATMVDAIFRKLGCTTSVAFSSREAKSKIVSEKNDLIILDWMLAQNLSADRLLWQAISTIEKFDKFSRRVSDHKFKVITYSSLPLSEIGFPENPYFRHVGHWQKPLRHSDLIKLSLDTLVHIGL